MKGVAMTSLTLTIVPLVDFFLDSILEGFCFLLQSKVQSGLTVLRGVRTKQGMF